METLPTVPSVDLARYAGRWYEIARYPAWFQRKCAKNTIAEYALQPNGTVSVENRCTTVEGRETVARGTARIADPVTRAKLKVKFSFFMPAGDYWIVDLDPDYAWAVVGEPKRRYVWILARRPSLDEPTFQAICDRLRTWQYDPNRLIRTIQDAS